MGGPPKASSGAGAFGSGSTHPKPRLNGCHTNTIVSTAALKAIPKLAPLPPLPHSQPTKPYFTRNPAQNQTNTIPSPLRPVQQPCTDHKPTKPTLREAKPSWPCARTANPTLPEQQTFHSSTTSLFVKVFGVPFHPKVQQNQQDNHRTGFLFLDPHLGPSSASMAPSRRRSTRSWSAGLGCVWLAPLLLGARLAILKIVASEIVR